MDPITYFLDDYSKESTKIAYTTAMRRYIEFMYKIPKPPSSKPVDNEIYERHAAQYLKEIREEGRNPAKDLLRYAQFLESTAPHTQKRYLNTPKLFLEAHKIRIEPDEHKKIRKRTRPTINATENEAFITHQDIRKILEFSPPVMRALILVLSSSGARIGEIMKIKLSDIHLDETPARIHLKAEYTKTRLPRNIFISSECSSALKSWMQYRNEYIRKKKGLSQYRDETDERVFPLSQDVVERMFTNSLERAGMINRDESTRRNSHVLHGFRKFFRRTIPLGSSNVKGSEITEQLLGHVHVLDTYFKVSLKELQEFYLEAEHAIWINTPVNVVTEDVKKMQREMSKMQATIDALLQVIDEKMKSEVGLKEQVKKLMDEKWKDLEIETVPATDEILEI